MVLVNQNLFYVKHSLGYCTGFSGGSVVKNLPAMQKQQETQVQSLSQEDSPVEGVTTHSSIPAWRILWTEESGRPQSIHRVAKSQT